MTTYTIKTEAVDMLVVDIEYADHEYTLEEITLDAENFGESLVDYIDKYLDVHQDNPMDEDELLENMSIENLAQYMEDSIREKIHAEMAPCTDIEFVREYLRYADLMI